MRRALLLAVLAVVLAGVSTLPAQQVGGRVFDDRNGNGVRDPNEPALAGVDVRLFGHTSGGGPIDISAATDPNGSYAFTPGDGCYLVQPADPAGWRLSQSRTDGFPASSSFMFPVGIPRFAKLDQGITNLDSGQYRFAALGDSIARNFNICTFPTAFWYSDQVRARLACVSPSTSFTLDKAAVLGEHTDDLLVPGTDNLNNVFQVIAAQPDLITLSMIGNDLLDVDPGSSPTQQDINRAVAEVLDGRQNLQEALSAMTSEVPGADIVLNSLYDNEAYNCTTGNPSAFHRTWLPIVDRILRDLAWGQARRASIAEVAAELAHEDQTGACTGFTGMICRDLFGLDDIHPTQNGYNILREKLWEATGGASLGSGDALSRSSINGVDYGYLRLVRRLSPTTWETRNGAAVTDPEAAFSGTDGGAAATITLGAGSEEVRLSGFPDWYDEIRVVRAVAGVRYRTTGTVNDDFYRMEASVTDQFRPPPGFSYTPTNWNFYTPIVGGGGPNQPPENPDYPNERLLAVPDVPAYREVTAALTKNPELPPGAAEYVWPAPDADDMNTATMRIAAAPVAGTPGNDGYAIELDHAWIDLYGYEVPRPGQVTGFDVTADPAGDLDVSFDSLAGAQRYNLYAGRLATLATGLYDHGHTAPLGPLCGVTTADAGGGRRSIDLAAASLPGDDLYFLITAHVDDVESPAGMRSDGSEVDRAQSVCR